MKSVKFSSSTLAIANCTAMALRRAARRVSQLYDSKLERAQLNLTQYVILITLNDFEDMSISDLASHVGMDRTTVGKSLRPLRRNGLVRIAASRADGRSRSIFLTDKGAATLRSATRLWRTAHREFERRTGKSGSNTLRASLERIGISS
jgi:DNA-binding MarR family transcriptional regulator